MKKTRVLGFLLALVLVVTCIPTSALAVGESKTGKSQIVEQTYGLEDEVAEEVAEVVEEATEAVEVEAETVEAEPAAEPASELEEDGIHTYKVYLPSGYDEAKSYPTVYLMPYDGYNSQKYVDDGIQAKLDEIMGGSNAIPMVVVMPDFEEGEDYSNLLSAIVADVEGKYSVIKESAFRAILGVNVGGYMALETAIISKSDAFYAMGSHMGDFTSEANPYLEKGSLNDTVSSWESLPMDKGYSFLSKHFIYIDGPNEDAFTTVEGGTSDVGGNLEKRTNPYYRYGGSTYLYSTPDLKLVEFAVLDGDNNADFYLSSMERSLNRFSARFTESLYTSSLSCAPQAVTSSDKTTEATVKFTVNDKVKLFADEVPDVKITITMSDPADGKVLYTDSKLLKGLAVDEEGVAKFTLETSKKADGVNTTIAATAEFLGMDHSLASLSLVAVQDTGTADDELQVDLMGNWYFNPYKGFDDPAEDLDSVDYVTKDVYEKWDVVQPGLGWWSADFAPSLNGQANFGGYAWYVRTFDMPKDFPTDGLLLGVGKFDEANEVFINGHFVGSNGMLYEGEVGVGGVYDFSNPWDVNNVYALDSSFLNYGGTNTIAVRMANSSGGGGWYEGPIGVYSQAAYNKAYGKPSVYAPSDVQDAVLKLVNEQIAAIEAEDIDAYAATLDGDYFESGFSKDRRVAQMAEWFEAYDNIKVVDDVTGVFEDKGLYNYQAVRKFTGTDAEGNTVDIIPANTEEDTIDENNAYEVSDYFTMNGDEAVAYGSHSRFFYDSYYSAVKGGEQTFRVYLPDGYFDADNAKRYPTMFLLHGINSQSKTFALDKIDQVVEKAIADGVMRETIVIIPDEPGRANGGWNGDMITKDLLPTVDERYRTIDDERYRFVGGCSMGGGGAFSVGLLNPNEFSGVISFYGALGVHTQVQSMSKEYLDQYGIVMVCGNQDMYNFYNTQEQMSRILFSKDVEHYHFVDAGGHDSVFYLPQFLKTVAKIEAKAYTTGGKAVDGITGEINVTEAADKVVVDYTAELPASVKDYFNTVAASDFTKETNPDLQIPVEIRVVQDGVVVASVTDYYSINDAGKLENSVEISTADFDAEAGYDVNVYVSVLEDTKLLGTTAVEEDVTTPDDDTDADTDADEDADVEDEKADTVKTGDEAPVMLYLVVAMMAAVVAIIAVKKRRA